MEISFMKSRNSSERDRNFLIEFIRFYRKLPAIWNQKCQEYRDVSMKEKSYALLLTKYREYYPSGTLEDVKKKINSLRSNYRRYRRKSGGETALYWFNEMSFIDGPEDMLEDIIDVEASYLVLKTDPLDAESVNESCEEQESTEEVEHYEVLDYEGVKSETFEDDSQDLHCTEEYHDETPAGKQKSELIYETKTHTPPRRPKLINKTSMTRRDSLPDDNESEYDFWGKVMAAELKKMAPLQQIFAKKAITEILLEGQLGQLSKDSVKINK